MIQVSFALPAAAPLEVALPLKLEPSDGGLRLTGVWPHRDLAAARRQVATALSQLPAESRVRCNFTGRERPAATWASELVQPPTVTSVFEARHALVEGRLIARLFGLYQLGESDLVLVADADSDVAEAYALLNAWARFRLGATEEPAWDRPFPWGYWLVSTAEAEVGDRDFWALVRESLGTQHLRDAFDARMSAPAPRVLIEAADPTDADTSYNIGVSAALRTSARQRRTHARLGAEPPLSPSAQDAAGFCDRIIAALDRDPRAPFFAYREASQGPLDSGWRFGCLDPEHVHDSASLRIAPLGRAKTPGLTDYLALPVGWVVTWEEDAFWTTAPGGDKSHRDEGATP